MIKWKKEDEGYCYVSPLLGYVYIFPPSEDDGWNEYKVQLCDDDKLRGQKWERFNTIEGDTLQEAKDKLKEEYKEYKDEIKKEIKERSYEMDDLDKLNKKIEGKLNKEDLET